MVARAVIGGTARPGVRAATGHWAQSHLVSNISTVRRTDATSSPRAQESADDFQKTRSPNSTTRTQIIPACHGFSFDVSKGSHWRITDLHGAQVVDMMAWRAPYSPSTACEHFSTSYTQYNLLGAAPPTIGEHLYSNHDNPMFEVVADTVKVHDMRFMACNPGFYRRIGQENHRNCATNIAEALTEYLSRCQSPLTPTRAERAGSSMVSPGSDHTSTCKSDTIQWYQVHDPFNCFQNTPYYAIKGGLNTSRAGDYIEFKAEMDAVVALSCCPYDTDNFNGGKVTDVAVTWEVIKTESCYTRA